MPPIEVIATTISGSIEDWSKVKQIIPLFKKYGFNDVNLVEVSSHGAAKKAACQALLNSCRYPISAGGSGTFRAVLEGCLESGVPLSDIRLGFLRKGSADLIGKTLGMPDNIDKSVGVFAKAINNDDWVPADVLEARLNSDLDKKSHYFIGYGGTGLFGRIPYYTENRFIKYYKGILGQIFGDLGPFTTGTILTLIEKLIKSPFSTTPQMQIWVDGKLVTSGQYHTIVVLNGYLGPDLPFSNEPLGSGEFYIYCFQDRGQLRLIKQLKKAFNGSITFSDELGIESYTVKQEFQIKYKNNSLFPVNIDGSYNVTNEKVTFSRFGTVPLLCCTHER